MIINQRGIRRHKKSNAVDDDSSAEKKNRNAIAQDKKSSKILIKGSGEIKEQQTSITQRAFKMMNKFENEMKEKLLKIENFSL